jgi:hypothetical protein
LRLDICAKCNFFPEPRCQGRQLLAYDLMHLKRRYLAERAAAPLAHGLLNERGKAKAKLITADHTVERVQRLGAAAKNGERAIHLTRYAGQVCMFSPAVP